MNGANFTDKLKELGMPVVSLESASALIQKPSGYTRVYMGRLHNAGAIRMIERGKYCLPNTDEYTIASRIIPQSYITGYAALMHYKLTTQITTEMQVIAPKYHRPIKLETYTVKFSKVKKEFIYGYASTSNGPVFAEPEKIFIDDLYLHGRQYYSEEFDFAMENNRLDLKKLRTYAQMADSPTLIKRIVKYLRKYGVDAKQKSNK
jgi:predicted transcriptional regulator of viral defense system